MRTRRHVPADRSAAIPCKDWRGPGARPAGSPIRYFRRSWLDAYRKAGLPGKIPHDLRRTSVRNLARAGADRETAMEMVGHKTESIYRRYTITDETMLHEWAARLAALLETE